MHSLTPTRRLDPAAALHWLARHALRAAHLTGHRTLSGQLGTRSLHARSFPAGLSVALTLDRPIAQAPQACLLLAATPQAYDDALYLADARLWLLRRYPPCLSATELGLLLQQQQMLAALLSVRAIEHNGHDSPSQDGFKNLSSLRLDRRYA